MIEFDERFKKRIVARYERATFEAGILVDSPHRRPQSAKRGLGTLRGGPVRKKSFKTQGTVADVGERIRKFHNVQYLTAPFEKPRSKEMLAFRKQMGEFLTQTDPSRSKIQTLFLRIIQTPILEGRYGRNTPYWAKVKSFNRFLFDTGQFFRSLAAKVRVSR